MATSFVPPNATSEQRNGKAVPDSIRMTAEYLENERSRCRANLHCALWTLGAYAEWLNHPGSDLRRPGCLDFDAMEWLTRQADSAFHDYIEALDATAEGKQ